MDRAPHLAHHLPKALVLHTADQVWAGAARHLVPDAHGHRAGAPHPGRWGDFQTIPGRARSHTTARKWETFRLVGTLQGHLDRYRTPTIPRGATVAEVLGYPAGTSVLRQPRRLRAPAPPASGSWGDHQGALAVVFRGGPASRAEELLLPVHLPQGAGSWAHTAHHLADPTAWHKVDLVRSRDPGAPGGWRDEAHLLVLKAPYRSPATERRRAQAAQLDRRVGVDVNVSNVTVVSFDRALTEARVTVVALDAGARAQRAAAHDRARQRARALDRSRRTTNAAQYTRSRALARRAARRAAAGLRPVTVALPRGARLTTAAGGPRQAYRRDQLSATYRRLRGATAAAGAAATRTRANRARRIAAEARAVAGLHSAPGLLRAATAPTALSQHCLCGARVPKTLADRLHRCPHCGLVGDRDRVSAALAACVTVPAPTDPRTARVDYATARCALATIEGLPAALSESTAAPPGRHRRRRDGRAQASARRRRAARRSAGPAPPTIPDELPPALARGDHAGASAGRAGPLQRSVPRQTFWKGA
ncbi:MAG TPA: transposase [Candidatus Dormibacteraeota bacterium]|nr:transposase [Candidatus Dormibacteraeota bacterium]